nr:MAG: hypothetical protein [Porcellio scaber clopovirus]
MWPKLICEFSFLGLLIITCLPTSHGESITEFEDDLNNGSLQNSEREKIPSIENKMNSTANFWFAGLFDTMKRFYKEMDDTTGKLVPTAIVSFLSIMTVIFIVFLICKKCK